MAQMPSVGQMLKTARRSLGNRDRIYQEKLAREIENYRAVENAHDLPQIFHYWSNKYLVRKYRQFEFSNPKDFYRLYTSQACQKHKEKRFCFVSIGSGNCDTEIEILEGLWAAGTRNFVLGVLTSTHTCWIAAAVWRDRGKSPTHLFHSGRHQLLAAKSKIANHHGQPGAAPFC